MDDLISEFVAETSEGIGELDNRLVALKRDPCDAAMLGGVFRIVHTIKGTCGFLGLDRLSAISHAAESVLVRFRDETLSPNASSITLVLAAIDRIKAILDGLEAAGAEPEGDDGDLIAALNTIAAAEDAPPRMESADAAKPTATPRDAVAAAQGIRVSVELLEDLIALVSELVLTRNQLLQTGNQAGAAAFTAPLQRLDQITSELQEGVMKTRMQPIGAAWSKLPRIVHDLEIELGKRIDLELLGEEVELDRQVLEVIRDPLVHMVRNSCDHGLETPQERLDAGKPETGRIAIHAYHEGGHVIVRVADDGRGLPADAIRARAIAKGFVSAADADRMAPHEFVRFIFEPGFTTVDAVTDVSGRGVGMDVVRSNIERFGGAVEADSLDGVGTTFTVRIPLTLAIVGALIVTSDGQRFAISETGVLEVARVGHGDCAIEQSDGGPTLCLRGRLLPLASLAERFGVAHAGAPVSAGYVVVCQAAEDCFGIAVDQVHDVQEIVVKPVAPILRGHRTFAGATVLGDGDVVMILDTARIAQDLMRDRNGVHAVSALRPAGAADARKKTPLLLFRAGDGPLKATPLGPVARLDDVPASAIERTGGGETMRHRDRVMPIVTLTGQCGRIDGNRPVIAFHDGDNWAGLRVDEIVDIVEIDAADGDRELLIDGRVVERFDPTPLLLRMHPDWNAERVALRRRSVLVVDDSAYFRHLLQPLLRDAGYDVTSVPGAAGALALKDAGHRFDLIVSEIELPEIDGFAFARAVKSSPEWAQTPLLAMCASQAQKRRGLQSQSGFAGLAGKTDREDLLRSMAEALAEQGNRP